MLHTRAVKLYDLIETQFIRNKMTANMKLKCIYQKHFQYHNLCKKKVTFFL